MSVAFKRETGTTPGKFRRLARLSFKYDPRLLWLKARQSKSATSGSSCRCC